MFSDCGWIYRRTVFRGEPVGDARVVFCGTGVTPKLEYCVSVGVIVLDDIVQRLSEGWRRFVLDHLRVANSRAAVFEQIES